MHGKTECGLNGAALSRQKQRSMRSFAVQQSCCDAATCTRVSFMGSICKPITGELTKDAPVGLEEGTVAPGDQHGHIWVLSQHLCQHSMGLIQVAHFPVRVQYRQLQLK